MLKRQPHPVLFQRYNIRRYVQPGRLRMTMAAGFNCYDGLIIAADRQITAEKHYTDQACKLSELRWANGIGIWGYQAVQKQPDIWGKN